MSGGGGTGRWPLSSLAPRKSFLSPAQPHKQPVRAGQPTVAAGGGAATAGVHKAKLKGGPVAQLGRRWWLRSSATSDRTFVRARTHMSRVRGVGITVAGEGDAGVEGWVVVVGG